FSRDWSSDVCSSDLMFPHYFERYKTDGVEHNMYIGASIAYRRVYNDIYLYNLRLWQLQIMWEMENEYYTLQKELPIKLDVASLEIGRASCRAKMKRI